MSRRNLVLGAMVAIPVLVAVWWLGSPLFLDEEVDEGLPVSVADARDAAATDRSQPEEAMEMPGESDLAPLATGMFEDFDELHRGMGTATIYKLANGSQILRLSEFEVTNGPALHVYLVPAADPADTDEIEGYVDLGTLKGNIGNQNYEIPEDVEVSRFGSVVIYCEPFHVIFSVASLA